MAGRKARNLKREEIQMFLKLRQFNGETVTSHRNQMFIIGMINLGLRCHEMLKLTRRHLMDSQGEIRDTVYLLEKEVKGKAAEEIRMNAHAKMVFRIWLKRQADEWGQESGDDFIIPQRNGRQVKVTTMCNLINRAKRELKLPGNVSTHSFRKTFAQTIYKRFMDQLADGRRVDPLLNTSQALRHKSIESTRHYIEPDRKEIDAAIDALGDFMFTTTQHLTTQ